MIIRTVYKQGLNNHADLFKTQIGFKGLAARLFSKPCLLTILHKTSASSRSYFLVAGYISLI